MSDNLSVDRIIDLISECDVWTVNNSPYIATHPTTNSDPAVSPYALWIGHSDKSFEYYGRVSIADLSTATIKDNCIFTKDHTGRDIEIRIYKIEPLLFI